MQIKLAFSNQICYNNHTLSIVYWLVKAPTEKSVRGFYFFAFLSSLFTFTLVNKPFPQRGQVLHHGL